MTDIQVISAQELEYHGKRYRCAIGANGFTDNPQEGDKATPLGTYALRECWYRADRINKPITALPSRVTQKSDGWCDDPTHALYNRHVTLPFPASHELLWREDSIYDIFIPIGFNDNPVVSGLGSAIMFHLARPDYAPTLGCVALALPDMLEILANTNLETRIAINV